jgi:ribosomal protein L31
MKEGIHPNYREVLFVDLSNGFKFVTRSCVPTKETETFEGKEYPLFKLDTSSNRTPSTPAPKSRWTTWAAAWRSSATASARSNLCFFRQKGSPGDRAAFLLPRPVCCAVPDRLLCLMPVFRP